MSDVRRGLAAGLLVASVLVVSGCGGGGDGGDSKPSARASSSKGAVSPRAALEEYEKATASGCTDATDCQAFMTRKLAAAVKVREAMKAAKDPSQYAEPIGDVNLAERQADHFGRDNLGAKGNSLAVSLPLQAMVAWFRVHPEA